MLRDVPRLMDPDPPLPPSFGVAEALAAGLTRGQIAHRLASGVWLTLSHGRYVRADAVTSMRNRFERERLAHVAMAEAMSMRYPDAVVSFRSGALVHRMPLWLPAPVGVEMLVPKGHRTGRLAQAHLRYAPLSSRHVLDGAMRITTPARTWFDLARTGSLTEALVAGDAAVRGGITSLRDLQSVIQEGQAIRGHGLAARAFEQVNATRESPAESASWAYFIEHGIPLPRMQVELFDLRGVVIARVDFLWDEVGLVGECDGRVKYETGRDLYAEKRRQELIEREGKSVIRWGTSDLRDDRLAHDIMARLSRHRRAS